LPFPVCTADGPPPRIGDKGRQHLSGAPGEKKYYLANLRAATADLAATIKSRCFANKAHQQLKEELGLDAPSKGDPGKVFTAIRS